LGYFKAVLLTNVIVLLAFLPNMIMLVSWIATASIYSFAFYPMLYTNMWFIPAWLMGTFAFIVGLFSVYSPSYVTLVCISKFRLVETSAETPP
jgi:hypothetical protein